MFRRAEEVAAREERQAAAARGELPGWIPPAPERVPERGYEAVVVLRPELTREETDHAVRQIKACMREERIVPTLALLRRSVPLQPPIHGKQLGTALLLRFHSQPAAVKELSRYLASRHIKAGSSAGSGGDGGGGGGGGRGGGGGGGEITPDQRPLLRWTLFRREDQGWDEGTFEERMGQEPPGREGE